VLPDLSDRDAPTDLALMTLLRRRPGVAGPAFFDYWSGGHTQISSRLPGMHQYWQHHLDFEAGQVWPAVDGVDRGLDEADAFQGDAEVTFLHPEDSARYFASLHPLMEDEQNVFEETISYHARGPNARTWVDRIPEDSPNGELHGIQKFMLYLQRRDDVSSDDFHLAMSNRFAGLMAGSELILKLRLRIVEPYDNDAVVNLAPNVSNFKAPEKQYQAGVEVAFASPLELRRFAATETWREASAVLAANVRTAHAFRARRTYTVYNHGHITTAGLRTPQVAEQIRRLGAVNQLDDEVLELILAAHVGTPHRLGRTTAGGELPT